MKRLNFLPHYRPLLETGDKSTTIRLSNREGLAIGDDVEITLGWSVAESKSLRKAQIIDVYQKRLGDLNETDFEGESPDCTQPYPTALVLSAIYRTLVGLDDMVWIVKFMYM